MNRKEDEGMTNKQTLALLEAVEILAETLSTKQLLTALERIKHQLSERSGHNENRDN